MKVDPVKAMIWSLLLLSGAGVASHLYLEKRIDQSQKDVKRALQTLAEISQAKEDIDVLSREMESDIYITNRAQNRLNSFFAEVARQAKMARGPSVQKPRDDTPRRAQGYRDESYELYWEKTREGPITFTREQAAAFMWWLEDRTSLLKVTDISLETKPTQDGEWTDLWELRLWVTERRPTNLGAVGES